MFLRRLITIVLIFFSLLFKSAFCASDFKVQDLILDNSDNVVVIKGQGNFIQNQEQVYSPVSDNNNQVNIINKITTFTITAPARYVVDIPFSTLIGVNRTYKINNSRYLQNVSLSQFSTNPNVVRVVFTLKNSNDLGKFKTYTDGSNIVVKYDNKIVGNQFQYKFYTNAGDSSYGANLQNLSAQLINHNSDEPKLIEPKFKTKYYLTQVSQNSDGLMLRGLGSISLEKTKYNSDATVASLNMDSASISDKLNNKTYRIPSSNLDTKTTLTLNRLNSKKVRLTLLGENLRDYRFLLSPDGQSLYISHRTYVVNTFFTTNSAKINNYKFQINQNGYKIIDLNFSMPVTYNVFELNNSLYLDVNNLSDFNEALFKQIFTTADIKISAYKIASDKTRFVIPYEGMSFSYANVESNSKSMRLCFKSNDAPVVEIKKEEPKKENINVVYIPKQENKEPKPPKKVVPPVMTSMKKVVIDAGHGGMDSGAISSGYQEKTLNLNVAKLVQEKLEKKDVYVYMTREKDTTLSLEDRVTYSNDLNPDIFVSIHTNSTLNPESYGLEIHYFKDDSIDLAHMIHKNFASDKNLRKWDTKDRGVIKSRFYVINHTEAPSVLIEMGFISNDEEREKLFKKNRQEEIANSIVKGILGYLKIK